MTQVETVKRPDMLFNLITGIQKWQGNFGVIPDELYTGMLMFAHLSAEGNSDPPVDIYQLIRILHRPSHEWGIQGLHNDYPEHSLFLKKPSV